MKKNSLLNMFIRKFIRNFIIMLLLVVVGFSSYKVTMFYYKITDGPKESKVGSVIDDIVDNVSVDDVSKNLIYSVDQKSGFIDDILIEIFNTNTGNLDYITIPANTQFTISNELYQSICTSNPEIPQIIKLSDIGEYFKESKVYDFGVVLVEDLLDIDISYYTVVKSEDFHTMFESSEKNLAFTDQSDVESNSENQIENLIGLDSNIVQTDVTILKFTGSYQKRLSTISSEEDIKAYLTELYKNIKSNLKLKKKLKYVQDYLLIKKEFIYFYGIYGEKNGSLFTVDTKTANALIQKVLNNDAYTVAQEESKENGMYSEITSSTGLNIQILNGSKITGLAAKYKEKLTLSGYDIVSVDNYLDAVLTNTKIITRTEGTGLDLLNNFKNAQVEIGDLPNGIDIRIILGTDDNIMK